MTIKKSNNTLRKIWGNGYSEENKLQDVSLESFFNYTYEAILIHPLRKRECAKFIEVNDYACKKYGYSRKEFLKLSLHDITKNNNDKECEAIKYIRKLANNGHHISEYTHIKKTGREFPVEINSNIIDHSGKRIIISVVRDISERKQAEEALRNSERKMSSIFRVAPTGIGVIKNRILIEVNPLICEMTGYTKEELTGKSARIFYPTRKEFDFVGQEKYRQISESGTGVVETRWQRKDGTIIEILLASTPIDVNDLTKGVTFTALDITDRKQMEKQLKAKNVEYLAINEELQESLKRIKDINKQLEIAKKKAEESDQLKSAFLANMSHEIRTPMNGILGFAELLKESHLTSNKQEEYLQLIEESGYRMLHLINDLVDVSRIEAGQIELHPDKISVNKIIEDLYLFFKHEAEIKQLALEYKTGLPDNKCTVELDKDKIMQVLSNLIKNAIKFTKAGKVTFGYTLKKSELEFFVHDTGVGILPDMKEVIFERFRQVDNSTSREYEGSGLGLSISKAYVEMHGGKIWVESKVGKGSSFYFTLPYLFYAAQNKTQFPAYNYSNITYPKDSTILVAEDEEVSYLVIKAMLEEINVNTIHAKNGEEAVTSMEQHPEIVLVLMDLKMPRMNGFDATQAIKIKYPDIPVIAQTAFAHPNDKQKALLSGCDDFITKPIQKETLLKLICKYLNVKSEK